MPHFVDARERTMANTKHTTVTSEDLKKVETGQSDPKTLRIYIDAVAIHRRMYFRHLGPEFEVPDKLGGKCEFR